MAASLSLLCLPCAGASATMYLRWRRALPAWIRVVPVELPGRGARLAEPHLHDYDAMVELVCREQAQAMQGNFALLGHSMGALLAFGVSRRLQAQGAALPRAVLVSASPAPTHRDPDRYGGKDDAALIADLRKQGGTPEEVFDSPELMRITLDTLGADYRVCDSFQWRDGPPLSMPLHVFAGRDDEITATQMQAWQQQAGAGCSFDWFDGGHFFIRHHEPLVLEAMTRRLAALPAMEFNATRRFA